MAFYTRLIAGWGPKNGAILATVAHQQTAPGSTLYVAATHFHPEHMMQLGPAHTRGDLGFFVEGDNVVFTGDVAMSRPLGINADSTYSSAPTNASVGLASLERLTNLKPVHVVPSHGPLGDGSMIEKHRLFMTDVRDRVRMLKRQGRTADQVVSALSDELAKKHDVPEKVVADAARLFYAELG